MKKSNVHKMIDNPGKRLAILGSAEIEDIYGRPCFMPEERDEYFALSAQEKEALGQFHPLKSRAFFILQLGYFKTRRMFFIFDLEDVEEDASYIQEKYFPGFDDDGPEI